LTRMTKQNKNSLPKQEKPQQENLTTILEGAKIDLAGRIFNAAIRYFYVFLLARFLGAELMGIFFLGIIIVEISGVFSRLGLETGVIKYVSIFLSQSDDQRTKGIIKSALLLSVMTSIIIAIVLFSCAEFIANDIFKKPGLNLILKILSVSLPFSSAMFILLSATQGFHTLKYKVYVEFLTNPALNIFLLILIFAIGFSLEGAALTFVFAFFFCSFLSFYFLKVLFPGITSSKLKTIFETKKLIKFSSPLILINLLSLLMMWTDILMLGYFKSGADVGIYNTVVKTAFFINFIIMSFTSIFAPRISELYFNKQKKELEALFKTVTRWIFGMSIPLFIIIVIFAKNILSLFGEQFISGSTSLVILAVAHLANASVGAVRYVLMMSENEKIVMYNTVIFSILNILLNMILIPKYGINGAALATAINLARNSFEPGSLNLNKWKNEFKSSHNSWNASIWDFPCGELPRRPGFVYWKQKRYEF